MKLEIVDRDLLTATGDAVFLPIDGEIAIGNASSISRSLGRIAREFSRRYPDVDLVEEIDAQAQFPIALGSAAPVELPEGSPFRYAILLSMLAHDSTKTDDKQLRRAISAAFADGLRVGRSL